MINIDYTQTVATITDIQETQMSNEHEDFSDNQPLTDTTQSQGSKTFEELNKEEQDRIMRSIANEFEDTAPYYDKHYRVKNIKYGEKTVTGRIIGRGEFRKVIPEEEVAQLSQYHCTNKEMADFFGVKLQTFMDNFRDIITKNRLITKQRLRKQMLTQALNGDRVLQIFLAKNYLGMSDNPIETDGNEVLPWTGEDDN